MDWQEPGLTLIVGDVAFVSASPEMGGRGIATICSIDWFWETAKQPLSTRGGRQKYIFLISSSNTSFPSAQNASLLSPGPFISSEVHSATALEENEQQGPKLCACLLGTRGLQGKAAWRPGIQLLWRPRGARASASFSTCKTVPLPLLTGVLQPLAWQKRYRLWIHYLWSLVKSALLYDHLFLLLLSFCTHLVWMSLRVGIALVFSQFNRYILSI